jgi:hypothetical protein
MLDRPAATILPFRAPARRAPGSRMRDRSLTCDPGARRDNVVPLRKTVPAPAAPAQRGMRRPERVMLVPPPGGEAA